MKILKIRAMAIVLDMPVTKEENWNSVFPRPLWQLSSPDTCHSLQSGRGIDRLAGVLYTKGLTQEQVGDVFEQIYGRHYSKSSISRMADSVRTQVNAWLERSLESYYPVMFVDCVHIKIHRKRSVSSEAFYVALAVT